MRYKLLGSSGLRVSELALGTMSFGDENGHGVADETVSRNLFDAFLEAGGNFIDTANDYTGGKSETHLGKFISSSMERDRLVIGTKYSANMRPDDPNGGGNSRKSMVHSVEASLKRLRSEYIDLLWVHMWDSVTPIEEVMHGLDALIAGGKGLYVGVSDHPAWVVAQSKYTRCVKTLDSVCGIANRIQPDPANAGKRTPSDGEGIRLNDYTLVRSGRRFVNREIQCEPGTKP